MVDHSAENLHAATLFVQMAKDFAAYSPTERHGFLMFAVMHACQAAVLGDSEPRRYGMRVHDYKHILIKAAQKVMDGTQIDLAMNDVPDTQYQAFMA